MSPPDKVGDALIDLALLDKRRGEFIRAIEASNQTGRTGWLSTTRGELNAQCFGHSLKSRSRPVARNGKVIACEYAFIGHSDASGGPWLAAKIYLTKSAKLRAHSPRGALVCAVDDADLVPRLTDAIAVEMLASKAFAPDR